MSAPPGRATPTCASVAADRLGVLARRSTRSPRPGVLARPSTRSPRPADHCVLACDRLRGYSPRMRLTATRRAIAALLAVWFTLVSVDPMWLHACPMHGGAPTRLAYDGALRGAQPQQSGHDHHTERSAPQPSHDDGHSCLCLGDCPSGGSAPLPAMAAALPTQDIVGAPTSPSVFWRVHRAAWLAYLLPYAHAPPTALS